MPDRGQTAPFASSSSGKGILVDTTGVSVHSVAPGQHHFLYMWAANSHSGAVTLTVRMGGTGAADIIEQSITNQGGLQKVLDGILISNSTGTAIAITAIATTTTDKITLFGHWEVA